MEKSNDTIPTDAMKFLFNLSNNYTLFLSNSIGTALKFLSSSYIQGKIDITTLESLLVQKNKTIDDFKCAFEKEINKLAGDKNASVKKILLSLSDGIKTSKNYDEMEDESSSGFKFEDDEIAIIDLIEKQKSQKIKTDQTSLNEVYYDINELITSLCWNCKDNSKKLDKQQLINDPIFNHLVDLDLNGQDRTFLKLIINEVLDEISIAEDNNNTKEILTLANGLINCYKDNPQIDIENEPTRKELQNALKNPIFLKDIFIFLHGIETGKLTNNSLLYIDVEDIAINYFNRIKEGCKKSLENERNPSINLSNPYQNSLIRRHDAFKQQ